MKRSIPNALARSLRDFLGEYMPRLRGLSPCTVHSYRDALKLLLKFIAERSQRSVSTLDLDDIGPTQVMEFLAALESKRGNCAATRNVRLAAIHAFFRYLAGAHPDRLEQCQRVLAVPFKRSRTRAVEYFDYAEIEAVLAAVDRGTADGRRDYALIGLMFNTGARVQEILDLRPRDLQLIRPFHARFVGKGRKERLCPLWPETAEILRDYLAERGFDAAETRPMFRNHRGEILTRFGVRYLLAKYCDMARASAPTLAGKRLHPHSMRHSTAVHMLQAGVDLSTISHWLGHASVNTTNRYTAIDMETKRKAIAKARAVTGAMPSAAAWRKKASLIEWLEAL